MRDRHNKTTKRAIYALSALRSLPYNMLGDERDHHQEDIGEGSRRRPSTASIERLPTGLFQRPGHRPPVSGSHAHPDVLEPRAVRITCSPGQFARLVSSVHSRGYFVLPRGRLP